VARIFQCPTCNKETHILRKRNPNRVLSIFAALASAGAWPGSLLTIIVLVALHLLR
jgi:hypothetical protein